MQHHQYPDLIILEDKDGIRDIQFYLDELSRNPELPTIDRDALLSLIFQAFTYVPDIQKNIERNAFFILEEGIFSKTDDSELRDHVLMATVRASTLLWNTLEDLGALIYEQFPYEYDQTRPDHSIVLRKITSTTPFNSYS